MEAPLFSVILPTYNRAYVLWRAVVSVLSQTERRWELVVVDDGSTDCTRRLLEEFRDPRVRVLTVGRRGPSAARNAGCRVARAPYVAYLDSDNEWRPAYLARMLDATARHPEAVVWYCGQRTTFWRRSEAGEWTKESELDETRAQFSLEDALALKGPDANCIVHRREALAEVGGWDERCRWLEDWDLFARFAVRFPGGARWVPEVLVEYRQVHGAGADGICAETARDPALNRAAWEYLIEKWRPVPGFAATAERLAAKHLSVEAPARRTRTDETAPRTSATTGPGRGPLRAGVRALRG